MHPNHIIYHVISYPIILISVIYFLLLIGIKQMSWDIRILQEDEIIRCGVRQSSAAHV